MMKRWITIIALFIAASLGTASTIDGPMVPSGGAASSAVITGQSLGTLRNNFSGIVGFKFTVGAANITVTDLGRWVPSGNSGSHTIYLTDASGTVLASVSVNTSGQPVAYLYGSITPTVLTAAAAYCIISQETSSGDQFYDDDTTLTSTADITVTTSCYTTSVGGSISTSTGGLHSYGPSNFKYHL